MNDCGRIYIECIRPEPSCKQILGPFCITTNMMMCSYPPVSWRIGQSLLFARCIVKNVMCFLRYVGESLGAVFLVMLKNEMIGINWEGAKHDSTNTHITISR